MIEIHYFKQEVEGPKAIHCQTGRDVLKAIIVIMNLRIMELWIIIQTILSIRLIGLAGRSLQIYNHGQSVPLTLASPPKAIDKTMSMHIIINYKQFSVNTASSIYHLSPQASCLSYASSLMVQVHVYLFGADAFLVESLSFIVLFSSPRSSKGMERRRKVALFSCLVGLSLLGILGTNFNWRSAVHLIRQQHTDTTNIRVIGK